MNTLAQYLATLPSQNSNQKELVPVLRGGQLINVPSGGVYNVLSFGAVGDGVTDDAPAINSAIAYASANGGRVVYLPDTLNGYAVGAPIELRNNIILKGDNTFGGRRSRVLPVAGYTGHLVQSRNFSAEEKIFFSGIDGIYFDGRNLTLNAVAMRIQESVIQNCSFRNGYTNALTIIGKTGDNGLSLNNTILLNYFGKGEIGDTPADWFRGIFQDYFTADLRVTMNYFENCRESCMELRGSTAIVTGNHLFNAKYGIVSLDTFERNFSNNFIENTDGAAIRILDGSSSRNLWMIVTSNMFRNINRLDLSLGVITTAGTGLNGCIVSNNILRRDTGETYEADYFVHSGTSTEYIVNNNVWQSGTIGIGQWNNP